LECPEVELSILIVDDSQIAALNQDYRNRSGPTNVIAFAMRDGAFAEVTPDLLGDVVISTETTAREAREMGLDFSRRFDELLIHGILHLVGYDHERGEDEALRMEARTRELLAAIGADSDSLLT
jgi:probable rRNA maturation factor